MTWTRSVSLTWGNRLAFVLHPSVLLILYYCYQQSYYNNTVMPLVTYNSSSSGEEEPVAAERNTLKRKRYHQKERNAALPALPSSFHDLYASAARMSTHDDPSLHGGRKRAIPHIEGQWPSHVFLECELLGRTGVIAHLLLMNTEGFRYPPKLHD